MQGTTLCPHLDHYSSDNFLYIALDQRSLCRVLGIDDQPVISHTIIKISTLMIILFPNSVTILKASLHGSILPLITASHANLDKFSSLLAAQSSVCRCFIELIPSLLKRTTTDPLMSSRNSLVDRSADSLYDRSLCALNLTSLHIDCGCIFSLGSISILAAV